MARFIRDEVGSASVEYALSASLISLALLSAIQMTGSDLKASFEGFTSELGVLNSSHPAAQTGGTDTGGTSWRRSCQDLEG
jgi:Flp pilus assembly pilin Flp